MVYKKKSEKFAIIVDEFGSKKKYLKKLVGVLQNEYPSLKQANKLITTKRLINAKVGDVIGFGFGSNYDFRVYSSEEWKNREVSPKVIIIDLKDDWEEVLYLLDNYVEENYPVKLTKKNKKCCFKEEVYIIKDFDPNEIYVIQRPKTRKSSKPTRKVKTSSLDLDKISVHHYFVKVGWDIYDIYLNDEGEEFVKIDGNVYWIDRDSSGVGKLSVR